MSGKLTEFLVNQGWMKAIYVLHRSGRARCLRELVDLTGLSPGGVQDLMRRLESNHIVQTRRSNNKLLYSLNLDKEELSLLDTIFLLEEKRKMQSRAELFSSRYEQAVGWIDETLRAVQHGRSKLKDRAP